MPRVGPHALSGRYMGILRFRASYQRMRITTCRRCRVAKRHLLVDDLHVNASSYVIRCFDVASGIL